MPSLKAIAEEIQIIAKYESCRKPLRRIEGYLDDEEGFALTLLAAHGPAEGAVVEIGSYRGRSTAFLALGCQLTNRGQVTAIDHFMGSPEHQIGQMFTDAEVAKRGTTFHAFNRNLEKVGLIDFVTPISMKSVDAARDWNRPIRLLFIDGDHSYESSKEDYELFEPFVVAGGVICFHDLGSWEGVTRFFNEIIETNRNLSLSFRVGSLAVVVKRGQ